MLIYNLKQHFQGIYREVWGEESKFLYLNAW